MSDTLTSSEALAKAYLAAFPNPAHLIVEEIPTCGCGQKFNIYAASDAYEGVKTLDRHRKTQAALDTGPF
jgi:stress-induced morphogen